jgi:hypothetical protein
MAGKNRITFPLLQGVEIFVKLLANHHKIFIFIRERKKAGKLLSLFSFLLPSRFS